MNISALEAKDLLEGNDDIILLDVRTEGEFGRGKIAGSINIPLDKFESDVHKVVPNKNSKVILYCLSGSRSAEAAEYLERQGYQNIFNMENGLLEWRVRGYPVN